MLVSCPASLTHVGHEAPTTGNAGRGDRRPGWMRWSRRWVFLVITVAVIGVELASVWGQLARAWHSVYTAKWWWVLAAMLAALASVHSFAQIQRTLLRAAGVAVKQWRSEAAFYAGNALSTTLPGGPVISTSFLYRQQRMWGASPVVAS